MFGSTGARAAFALIATVSAFQHRTWAHPSPCAAGLQTGDSCSVTVRQLAPTQLTYGKIEVTQRAAGFADLSDKDLKDYIDKHPEPIVVGPAGSLYITDGHHMAMAMAEARGKDVAILGQILHDWSALDAKTFWQQMDAEQLTYLHDALGHGPFPPSALPATLFDLADDPFRSLAWGVRQEGGYDDTTVPHADFLWADFFRSRMTADGVNADFDSAVTAGIDYAESTAAAALPGYHGP